MDVEDGVPAGLNVATVPVAVTDAVVAAPKTQAQGREQGPPLVAGDAPPQTPGTFVAAARPASLRALTRPSVPEARRLRPQGGLVTATVEGALRVGRATVRDATP